MYTLFKERWYLDNTVQTKHEVEKEHCATLEIARENMLYDFDKIAGNWTTCLLKNSFIATHRDSKGFCDRIIQYGILQGEVEEA